MTRISRCVGFIALGIVLAGAVACSKGANGATEEPKAGRPPVAVGVVAVAQADLAEAVDVVGTLEPKFSTDVKSEVTGVVTDVYVDDWVAVKKGDRLARLDTRETEAGIETLKAGEAQARVAETRAKREYERALQLKQYGLITPQALDDAKSAVEASEAATAAARAQIKTAEARLAKSFITAPMDRRRRPSRRERGRPRREHGRQLGGVPDRGQPAARPERVGALGAASRPSTSGSRWSSRPTRCRAAPSRAR